MLNHLIYLFQCADKLNEQSPMRAITILNTIDYMYKELRKQYKIPIALDNEEDFTRYLDDERVEDYYTDDLPFVCKILLKDDNFLHNIGNSNNRYNKKLKKRRERIIKFFGFEGVDKLKGNTEK